VGDFGLVVGVILDCLGRAILLFKNFVAHACARFSDFAGRNWTLSRRLMLGKLRLGEFRDKILNNPSRKWIEFWISRLLAKGDTLAHANIIREDDKT
jgi:hypothetical protein